MSKPASKKRSAKPTEEDFVVSDDGDGEPSTKRSKSSKEPVLPGQRGKNDEGNFFWELGGRMRRLTVGKYKGSTLVSIRDYYEKDGKILPGKKGVSLSVEQFNTVLKVLPEVQLLLNKDGLEMFQPELANDDELEAYRENGHPEWVEGKVAKKAKPKKEKPKVKVEDEDEDEGEGEEDEE